jgi:hypothetical protein
MHYDCRQSYCETLKQLMRVTREQVCGNYIFAIYVEILSHIS